MCGTIVKLRLSYTSFQLSRGQSAGLFCGTDCDFHSMFKFLGAHVTGVGGKDTFARSPADAAKLGVVVILQIANDVVTSCGQKNLAAGS